MNKPTDINPRIIEALYNEALVLAEETRAAFDLSGRLDDIGADEDMGRIALSCEALRTTTRMMHIIAWLLNQRAYLAGELSELQLRRHGRLPPRMARSDPGQLALIDPATRELILNSERLHARISRLDGAWQAKFEMAPSAINRLRDRLSSQIARI